MVKLGSLSWVVEVEGGAEAADVAAGMSDEMDAVVESASETDEAIADVVGQVEELDSAVEGVGGDVGIESDDGDDLQAGGFEDFAEPRGSSSGSLFDVPGLEFGAGAGLGAKLSGAAAAVKAKLIAGGKLFVSALFSKAAGAIVSGLGIGIGGVELMRRAGFFDRIEEMGDRARMVVPESLRDAILSMPGVTLASIVGNGIVSGLDGSGWFDVGEAIEGMKESYEIHTDAFVNTVDRVEDTWEDATSTVGDFEDAVSGFVSWVDGNIPDTPSIDESDTPGWFDDIAEAGSDAADDGLFGPLGKGVTGVTSIESDVGPDVSAASARPSDTGETHIHIEQRNDISERQDADEVVDEIVDELSGRLADDVFNSSRF